MQRRQSSSRLSAATHTHTHTHTHTQTLARYSIARSRLSLSLSIAHNIRALVEGEKAYCICRHQSLTVSQAVTVKPAERERKKERKRGMKAAGKERRSVERKCKKRARVHLCARKMHTQTHTHTRCSLFGRSVASVCTIFSCFFPRLRLHSPGTGTRAYAAAAHLETGFPLESSSCRSSLSLMYSLLLLSHRLHPKRVPLALALSLDLLILTLILMLKQIIRR